MRNRISSIAVLAALLLSACGPTVYVPGPPPPQAYGGWSGDPCDQSFFDAVACQLAFSQGGWYYHGAFVRHSYGSYNYNYYVRQHDVYVTHGGRTTPYKQAVQSVGSSSRTYTPPGNKPAATVLKQPSTPARTYTPPAASSPSRSYTPPSRPSSSRSYSPPSRSNRR